MKSKNKVLAKGSEDLEFVQELAHKVADRGGRVYYVGGCVRDWHIGKENKDIDIEVHGISQDDLQAILAEYGAVNEIGKSFGVLKAFGHPEIDIAMPRREVCTGDKHTDFDVKVDPFMGTKEAAKRRDFTMNALMQDVLTGEIVDHYGGLEDMENHVIRHVDDHTFGEDALRVLRAAQFSARFDYDIADETKEIMRSQDLSHLPQERIGEELKKAMMKSEHPSRFFEALRDVNQLDIWFPEVKALIGVQQNAFYHKEGDVWNHTMIVIDRAATVKDETSNPYGFMLSALCHDFGKPATAEYDEKKGVWHNIGHPKAGLEPAGTFMDRVVRDNKLKDIVEDMVIYHDIFFDTNVGVNKSCLMFDKIKNLDMLPYMKWSDNHNASEENRDSYQQWLNERIDIYKQRAGSPHPTGQDLMVMGLTPGPLFSEILDDAHKQILCGATKDNVMKGIESKYGNNVSVNKLNGKQLGE